MVGGGGGGGDGGDDDPEVVRIIGDDGDRGYDDGDDGVSNGGVVVMVMGIPLSSYSEHLEPC